jgi:hypothetical protein
MLILIVMLLLNVQLYSTISTLDSILACSCAEQGGFSGSLPSFY